MINDEIRLMSELTRSVYRHSNGSEVAIMRIADDVFMTSKEMAKMFGVQVPAVNKKLKKIFDSGALNKKLVSSILTHRASDGKLYRTTFYNGQVIARIGSMLRSDEARGFQEWLMASEAIESLG